MWWGLFGATALAWVAILICVCSGWTPPDVTYAGMATAGLALALTFRPLGVRSLWRKGRRGRTSGLRSR
ncbi:hypothetical protein DFJ67_4295 [Asanoa ferruginea]|uniref:DUF2530 domain-containing protein n=1 Tax=Asanoa ferruginea TaxID=53367 RepID=A0A3D9ZN35_9ACTN|nr:hypothetical protein DFJ67_4295 [Asanoa ferruginea]GIF52015.1 hypothetical protein Afe04nite_65540 [Asanoa ferruginea]